MSADQLTIWTIYQRPADFPAGFVTREWSVLPGQIIPGKVRYASDLEAARRLVPPGLYRLPRHDSDDPVVVESWV